MEFLNVMLKVWMKYWNLFLQGLGMTLFMGLLTVLISTVFGSLMALMRRSNVGIGKFKPLRLIATVYVEIIRGTPAAAIFLLLYAADLAPVPQLKRVYMRYDCMLRKLYRLCL